MFPVLLYVINGSRSRSLFLCLHVLMCSCALVAAAGLKWENQEKRPRRFFFSQLTQFRQEQNHWPHLAIHMQSVLFIKTKICHKNTVHKTSTPNNHKRNENKNNKIEESIKSSSENLCQMKNHMNSLQKHQILSFMVQISQLKYDKTDL